MLKKILIAGVIFASMVGPAAAAVCTSADYDGPYAGPGGTSCNGLILNRYIPKTTPPNFGYECQPHVGNGSATLAKAMESCFDYIWHYTNKTVSTGNVDLYWDRKW